MEAKQKIYVYVGTYSGKEQNGIHVFTMDPASGILHPVDAVSGFENPAFLAIHPNSGFLYAVGETDNTDRQKSGAVNAFRIESETGKLSFLNQQLSGGPGPCHLNVDASGCCVVVANYSAGSVSLLPIRDNGELDAPTSTVEHQGSSIHPTRQSKPHAHSITPDPTNRYAFVPDLGLDQILTYRIDVDSLRLVPHTVPHTPVDPGSGPRHLDFHPTGRYVYVINELGNTVMVFTYDSDRGLLEHIQTVPSLPDGYHGTSHTADIHVSPSGRFVYGSNRGHDSIVIYAADQDTGMLTLIGHKPTQGKIPRNFAIDPTGLYLLAANQDSDNIVAFRIDKQAGTLIPTGYTTAVQKPVCVKFLVSMNAAGSSG